MKNTISILIAFFFVITMSAQDIYEKNIALDGIGKANFQLDFSDQIIIKTWNKQEVYIKAIVNINDNTDNDKYTLTARESGDELLIEAEIDNISKIGRTTTTTSSRGMIVRDDSHCIQLEIDYEILVPENLAVELKTISGDVEAFGLKSPVRMKSISGLIDLSIPADLNADLKIETVTGEIYSDLDLEVEHEGKFMHAFPGGDVEARLNGGGLNIRLKTVSGNIYLRKE
ncbi:MAG: hypothetical protein ACLFPE_07935 [Bacteroidales bacterium]